MFVFSLGYVAAEKIFADERRLLSIESELAIAREIQNSIFRAAFLHSRASVSTPLIIP